MQTGLKEVADHLGISVSTVSRVVTGKDRVSKETREKVLKALNELDYQPNDMARVLRGKQSNTIGIVVSDISNIFFASLIKGAENAAAKQGYSILVCNTGGDPEREKKSVDVLLSKSVSGIIMAAASYESTFKNLSTKQAPLFVFIDNLPKHTKSYSSVSIDNIRAAREITERLIAHGHRRIAILAGTQAESSGKDRIKGWKEAMRAHNILIPEHLIAAGDFTLESGFSCMEKLLMQKTRPTAILASNNSLAYGAMLALREHGYSVPNDFSIAAFDADDQTRLIMPVLMSINQPVLEFGKIAVELCLKHKLKKKSISNEQIILDYQFIEGNSVVFIKQ